MISKKSWAYAQSLFETDSNPELFSQLKSLSDIFTQPKHMDFFTSFTVPSEEKKKLLEQALKNNHPLLKNFFLVLLVNKSFSLLSQIVSAYQKLMEDKNQLCSGTVFSPSPVSEEQKQQLEKSLQKFFNKKIELQFKEDKTLIGGLYIDVGGYIFNSTVKHQLKHFKSSGG